MASTLGRGKIAAGQTGRVSVTALFDFALERHVVQQKAGWFEFATARLGQTRRQAIDFLKKNLLVASSLHKSVLNNVLKDPKPGAATLPRVTSRSRSGATHASPWPAPEARATPTSNDPINQLYDELAVLTADQMTRPKDAKLRRQVSSKLAQLRALQEAEAAVIQQRFLGSLSVPLGTLQNLLNPTREFSGRDEDPAVADDTPDVAD